MNFVMIPTGISAREEMCAPFLRKFANLSKKVFTE